MHEAPVCQLPKGRVVDILMEINGIFFFFLPLSFLFFKFSKYDNTFTEDLVSIEQSYIKIHYECMCKVTSVVLDSLQPYGP